MADDFLRLSVLSSSENPPLTSPTPTLPLRPLKNATSPLAEDPLKPPMAPPELRLLPSPIGSPSIEAYEDNVWGENTFYNTI